MPLKTDINIWRRLMSSIQQTPIDIHADDLDELETQEWLEALSAVLDREGPERAHYLIERLTDLARRSGSRIPFSPYTAYLNTIPVGLEPEYPGDPVLEERIRSYIRWNAMAMVVKANQDAPSDGGGLGGHIASFASLATMIECEIGRASCRERAEMWVGGESVRSK